MANRSGFQIQKSDAASKSMVRATWPSVLKLMRGSADLGLARQWRNRRSDGVLVLRTVGTDREPLSDLPAMTADDISFWRPFLALGGRIILEVRINERFQTDTASFVALCEASVAPAASIAEAGFIPGVLVTSEGNPPGTATDPYGLEAFWLQPRVLAALRKLRALGAVWMPHGYSHPPALSDEAFHATRPTGVLAALPEDCRLNYLYGESGCDGGTDQPGQKPGRGWQDYFKTPAAYRVWCERKRAAVAADPLCLGEAIFLSGADPAGKPSFVSFDIRDEVDFRALFTDDVSGSAVMRLTTHQDAQHGGSTAPEAHPGGPAPVMAPGVNTGPAPARGPASGSGKETRMEAGLFFRMAADVPEKSVDEVAALCRSGGFTIVCPKAADGDELEGDFDSGVLAIKTLDNLTQQRDAYAALGIRLVPWVVPRGRNVDAEAALHARVAAICGEVLIDWEFGYPGFWDGTQSWGDAVSYFWKVRSGAGAGAKISLCPDPRQIARADYPVGGITPNISSVAPQAYFTDFGQQWQDALSVSVNLQVNGLPVHPVLPGDAHTADLVEAVRWLRDQVKVQRVYVFQRLGLVPGDFAHLKPELERALPTGPTRADYESNAWAPINLGLQYLAGRGGDDLADAQKIAAVLDHQHAIHP